MILLAIILIFGYICVTGDAYVCNDATITNDIVKTGDFNESIGWTEMLNIQQKFDPSLHEWVAFRSWDSTIRQYPFDNCDIKNKSSEIIHLSDIWYSSTLLLPRDIIFVIDKSGSMMSVWQQTITVIDKIIDSLNPYDRINIIMFDTHATDVHPTLLLATHMNKTLIKSKLNTYSPGGWTNFEEAFKNLFAMRELHSNSKNCRSIAIFITDGHQTHGSTNINSIIQSHPPMEIFTFTIGNNADNTTMKQIACDNNGIWTNIENFRDISLYDEYYYINNTRKIIQNNIMSYPEIENNIPIGVWAFKLKHHTPDQISCFQPGFTYIQSIRNAIGPDSVCDDDHDVYEFPQIIHCNPQPKIFENSCENNLISENTNFAWIFIIIIIITIIFFLLIALFIFLILLSKYNKNKNKNKNKKYSTFELPDEPIIIDYINTRLQFIDENFK